MRAENLSRREREIMAILYSHGETTAARVRQQMSGSPSDATVRTLLRILIEKKVIRSRQVGKLYHYRPVQSKKQAAKLALQSVLDVFFNGSVEEALASHLADPKTTLNEEQLRKLRELVSQAEQRERS